MSPSTGKKVITIHVLPNISRGKSNEIECDVRNIFVQKSCGKCAKEATSRPVLFEKVFYEIK